MKVLCLIHLKISCYFCFSRAINYEKKNILQMKNLRKLMSSMSLKN
eukprot:UN15570